MRQRLIYILKHNTIIQRLYISVMSFIFRLWGFFLNTENDLVLFVSFMGKGFNDSPKVLYDLMKSERRFDGYRLIWAFEEPERFRDPDKYGDLNAIRIDSLEYFKTALKAKYWITNTNIERGLHFKKKDQIYLNTWHGVALKLIGNDCPGRNDYDLSVVDHFVVSGKHEEEISPKALGVRPETYLRCGFPRNEDLWKVTAETVKEKRDLLGIPEDKKMILYAPTWRESTDRGKSYAIKPPIDFVKWQEQLGDDYIVFFRAHHQTNKILGVEFNDFVRDASDYPVLNDLMIASDILITDYSAIAFDYSILEKPIFTYAYDYDTYLKERGTYFDMDEVYPNRSCRTEEDLLLKIKNMDPAAEAEKTRAFRDRFIQYGKDSAAVCIRAAFGDN